MSESALTPTDEDLLAFDRGLLADEATDVVARWLEGHPEGEARIQHLAEQAPDEAVAALRAPCRIDDELARLSGLAARVMERVLEDRDPRGPMQSGPLPEAIRDYRLLGLLGQGGMGRVYRARHAHLQRDVALKVLPAHLAADPTFRTRFEREMAIVGQLDHPHLVRAHDAGIDGSYLFLAMELLDGLDLGRIVHAHGPLRVADACEAIRQAALGLQHAHQHGTVHCDVKPSNLFLTRSGIVKVIDLGLARATAARPGGEGLSSAQMVMGTFEYMAPEQWESRNVGPRADIYGLGCVLFCLLTGQPPFIRNPMDSWIVLQDAHRKDPPPRLRDLRPDIPVELANLVARMLAKSPDERPGSAQDVAEALTRIATGHSLTGLVQVEGHSLQIGKSTPTPGPRRARSRFPWLAIAAALGGVLVLGLAIHFWIVPSLQSHAERPDADAGKTKPPDKPEAWPLVLKPAHTLTGHTDKVLAVAISPKGDVVASAGADRTILLWDARTRKARGPLRGHSGEVFALAFSPDGGTLASVGDTPDHCQIRLWDVAAAQARGTLGGANSGNMAVAYSRDGQMIACGGLNRAVHIYDVATGKEFRALTDLATRFVRSLSISPDGNLLATGGSGPTQLWNLSTGKEVPAQLTENMNPAFLPNGKELACWSYHTGRVTLCEIPPGRKRTSWQAHSPVIEGLAVSSDGRFLASLGRDGAKLWRVADQKEIAHLKGHRGAIYAASFSADGKHLATAGLDDLTVRIWDLPELFHTLR